MSGAEAILVLGVICFIITIIDKTAEAYEALKDASRLPEAFRQVADRLPIFESILNSVERRIKKGGIDENSCKEVRPVLEACKDKAQKLKGLFDATILPDGSSDMKRYIKAVKTVGKKNKVEGLMKSMLQDIELLAFEHGMKVVSEAEEEQVAQAIAEVSTIATSISDDDYYGRGDQYDVRGYNVAMGSANQYVQQDNGTMNFGKN